MPRNSRESSALPGLLIGAVIAAILLLFIVLVLVGYWLTRRPSPRATVAATLPVPQALQVQRAPAAVTNAQMLLGDPSDATPDPSHPDNYLLLKPYFTLAYNNSAGEPRWVSWRLCFGDLGDAPRKRTFDPDDSLPAGFNVIVTHDYTGSGFDRGHMCDHSDRAATIESSYATFIMTNIVPQAPNNNRKCWAQLENYCRELARSGDRLYITSGPAGRGGVGRNGPAETIADGKVVVPAETWKVIVVTSDVGQDDVANVSAVDRVIAVDVPNDDGKCGEEWAGFRCSPAAIEAKTGLHFFTALPADVRATFENEVDRSSIAPPRPVVHALAVRPQHSARRTAIRF
jgi:endonuclease G